jgi:hypothetical protein
MHYVGLVDNDSHEDWVRQVQGRALIDNHASGELQVVGHPKPATDLPSELLEVLPAPPVLNKLVIVDDKLMVPKDLEETWSANPKIQKQFAEMIDAVALELGNSWTKWDALPPSQPANTNTPMKRPGDDLAALSPPKKAKVGEDKVIEEGKMVGGEDLFCTQILGGKSYVDVFLVIKPSHRIYIVNRSTKPVELPDGFLLAGFGKGTFKFLSKEPDANPDTHIALSLAGSDTHVLLDNKMRTLKDVIEEKRKTDPSPKVMYHNMEDVPGGGLGAFRLVVVHEVLFGLLEQEVPKDGKDSRDKMLTNRIGALIPTNFWESHCLDIIWAMRWVPTGRAVHQSRQKQLVHRLVRRDKPAAVRGLGRAGVLKWSTRGLQKETKSSFCLAYVWIPKTDASLVPKPSLVHQGGCRCFQLMQTSNSLALRWV